VTQPTPVLPATLNYSGPDAALPPPLDHPGMYLSTPPKRINWLYAGQVAMGLFYGVSLIVFLTWLSEELLPRRSLLRLAKPVFPVVGMIGLAIVGKLLARRESRRGWRVGLLVGGWVVAVLYGMFLIARGFLNGLLS